MGAATRHKPAVPIAAADSAVHASAGPPSPRSKPEAPNLPGGHPLSRPLDNLPATCRPRTPRSQVVLRELSFRFGTFTAVECAAKRGKRGA